MKKIKIYTDGSCLGNPGPGGYAAILIYEAKNQRKTIKGRQANTTNNQMELLAAIEALKLLKEPCEVLLYTDSKYVKEGMTSWIEGWKKQGWKNSAKKPVKNADLWQSLDQLAAKHQISWNWVKAHAGHPENELVDDLAREEATNQQQLES